MVLGPRDVTNGDERRDVPESHLFRVQSARVQLSLSKKGSKKTGNKMRAKNQQKFIQGYETTCLAQKRACPSRSSESIRLNNMYDSPVGCHQDTAAHRTEGVLCGLNCLPETDRRWRSGKADREADDRYMYVLTCTFAIGVCLHCLALICKALSSMDYLIRGSAEDRRALNAG